MREVCWGGDSGHAPGEDIFVFEGTQVWTFWFCAMVPGAVAAILKPERTNLRTKTNALRISEQNNDGKLCFLEAVIAPLMLQP